MNRILQIVVVCSTLCSAAWAQYGDPEARGTNQLLANRVRCQFYNYGLMGNIWEISFEWPSGTGNQYAGDFSPLWGAEFVHPSGDTLRSVITSYGPRGNPDGPPGNAVFWGFEPLPGFAADPPPTPQRGVAMSDQPDTWPESWPGRGSEWNGQWIGPRLPGHAWANQEAYFQADDNADMEWRERSGQTLYPFPQDTNRGGLGLRMEVRMLEFTDAPARDAILIEYILHNDGEVNVLRSRFGFMVGTLAGGRWDSEDDLVGYDEELDLAYSYDGDDVGSPGWVPVIPGSINVGYFGVQFIRTPQDCGLTSVYEFAPPGAVRMRDDAALWSRMNPGRFEIIGTPEDGDMIVATGDFALPPGAVDTIVAAVLFGVDLPGLRSQAQALREVYEEWWLDVREGDDVALPAETALSLAYPNPFNPETVLWMSLPRQQRVNVSVYDVLGRRVAVLADGVKAAGVHRLTFAGAALPAGVYFARMNAVDASVTRKLLLVK